MLLQILANRLTERSHELSLLSEAVCLKRLEMFPDDRFQVFLNLGPVIYIALAAVSILAQFLNQLLKVLVRAFQQAYSLTGYFMPENRPLPG